MQKIKIKQKQKAKSNLEIEELFISAVINLKDSFIVLNAGVKNNWFHIYQKEWKFISKFIQKHNKIPSRKIFQKQFPDFKIHKDVDEYDHLLEEIKQAHIRQVLIEEVHDLTTDLKMRSIEPSKIIRSTRDKFNDIIHETNGRQNEIEIISEWKPVYADVSKRASLAEDSGQVGAPTGFPTLDLATSGLQPSHFWTIGARLGEGKTWCLVKMAVAALMSGYRVQFDSLEQSRNQIAIRTHTFLHERAGLNIFNSLQLSNGRNVNLREYKKFLRGLQSNINSQMFISDTSRGRVDIDAIAAQIERNHPDILFLDYIQLMAETADWQSVRQVSADLATLSTKYNICIVAASQVNRQSLVSNSKNNPGAEHFSGSDSIGQDSDALVTIKRISRSVNRLQLVKYRHGPDGQKFYTHFAPGYGVFEEIARAEADDLIQSDHESDD